VNQKVLEDQVVYDGDRSTAATLLDNPSVIRIISEMSHKYLAWYSRCLKRYQ